MGVYLARANDGILDLAVRAADRASAKALLAPTDVVELAELSDKVAQTMNVPAEEGVHRGVVWLWVKGPTNFLGERPSAKPE